MVGTNDLEKAKSFYTELLGVLGAKPMPAGERSVAFGVSPDQPMLAVTKPFDGKAATFGNGTMISLRCKDKAQVDALYEKAMSLGAASEGEAGPRGPGDAYYGAYFRDLDGNKLAGFTMNK
jgi:predicted lactoylglutathione lyase